jgi:hypothetical protein
VGVGTTVGCVNQYIKDQRLEPEAVIILTDGYVESDWGGSWDRPTLWVSTEKHNVSPHGKNYLFREGIIMGVMIPEKFATHCKSIKATVDFSTFGPIQKKNIYKMVKTGRFGSAWNESPTTVIAKSIYKETKQPYFQIQGDEISM